MRRQTLAGLEVVLAGGTDDDGGGDGPVVVLLHGFGAPGEDLVGLARVLEVPRNVRFVFPAAPLTVDAEWGGRAWWMIDVMALQSALLEGRMRDLTSEVPAGLAPARAKIDALLDEIERSLGGARLVLGGFSQGAMLSLDVALRRARPPSAVVLMSGTLIAESEWSPLMPAKKSLAVFQSHGIADPLLPFVVAERLHDQLTAAGLSVDWVPFRGQHEIPPAVLRGLGKFLTKILAS